MKRHVYLHSGLGGCLLAPFRALRTLLALLAVAWVVWCWGQAGGWTLAGMEQVLLSVEAHWTEAAGATGMSCNCMVVAGPAFLLGTGQGAVCVLDLSGCDRETADVYLNQTAREAEWALENWYMVVRQKGGPRAEIH